MSEAPLEINGWSIYAHPPFLDQLERLVGEVEKARERDPAGYKKKRAAKLLAAIMKVAFENIPGDPSARSIAKAIRSAMNTSIGFVRNSCSRCGCSSVIRNPRRRG